MWWLMTVKYLDGELESGVWSDEEMKANMANLDGSKIDYVSVKTLEPVK